MKKNKKIICFVATLIATGFISVNAQNEKKKTNTP